MTSIITPKLIQFLRAQFRLDWNGIHGARHWARVKLNGLKVAQKSGANIEVVSLFAFLHDSCRVDDGFDKDHGTRAADLAIQLQGEYFHLSPLQLQQLYTACVGHSNSGLSDCPTIQTCWDADRVDLGRIGIYPDINYLSTYAAEIPGLVEWAWNRSQSDQ